MKSFCIFFFLYSSLLNFVHPNSKLTANQTSNVEPKKNSFLKTYQSSNSENSYLAIDGDLGTCSATLKEKFPYWGVEFVERKKIGSIRIVLKDSMVEDLKKIQRKNEPSLSAIVIEDKGKSTKCHPIGHLKKETTFVCDPPLIGKAVALVKKFDKKMPLRICEVSISSSTNITVPIELPKKPIEKPKFVLDPEKNLAFGQFTLQSTNSEKAGLALDGNISTCALTKKKYNSWWNVVLDNRQKIGSVQILLHSRLVNIYKKVAPKNSKLELSVFIGRNQRCGQKFVGLPKKIMNFKCKPNTRGASIMIRLKSKPPLSLALCEVIVSPPKNVSVI